MTTVGAVLFVVGLAAGQPFFTVAGFMLAALGAVVAWHNTHREQPQVDPSLTWSCCLGRGEHQVGCYYRPWRNPPRLTAEELAELDDARDGPPVRKVPR